MKPTLVILAAGIGSRYGGLKQLEAVGPGGAAIMDYSIYDALRAGFGKAVFVIRPDMEDAFRETIGRRYERHIPVAYAFQRLGAVPAGFTAPPDRKKPWGTGHAVLAAEAQVHEPFAAINADDFYGANSFASLGKFLQQEEAADVPTYAMVGYTLRDTLAEAGPVNRGCCRCTRDGWLERITEINAIERHGRDGRHADEAGNVHVISGDELVSMNLWGFRPIFFEQLRELLAEFLRENAASKTAEFHLPTAIQDLIHARRARVRVLPTTDTWVGVTHREDRARVVRMISELVGQGRYPQKLWGPGHRRYLVWRHAPKGVDARRPNDHRAAQPAPVATKTPGLSMPADPETIAGRFAVAGELAAAEPFAGGHINDSYLLTYRRESETVRFLLQRTNELVFPDPALVMENIQRVTAHIARKLKSQGASDIGRRVLTLIPTHQNEPCYRDEAGSYWRLYRFIEHTRVREAVKTPEQATHAGRMFGTFQLQLADLGRPRLHETIPDFHNTPLRYEALDRAVQADPCNRASVARAEIDLADRHRALAGVLLDLHRRGEIPERVVHNDAKISNVLFDAGTGEALCVVDLDTVMPGLSLYDFGDMVRSMTCTAAEDETDLSRVEVQTPLFEALARGYLEAVGEFLTAVERRHLVFAGKLITLEQAVRFLTDFLNGDTYYKTQRPNHNLDRCRAQFKLVDSIARHETRMNESVARL